MRYAIITEGITHKAFHPVDEIDEESVKARALDLQASQLSSSPVLLIDFEEKNALRIIFDGAEKVTFADTAQEMYGLNTPIEEMEG